MTDSEIRERWERFQRETKAEADRVVRSHEARERIARAMVVFAKSVMRGRR
jgi:hypothetical protein